MLSSLPKRSSERLQCTSRLSLASDSWPRNIREDGCEAQAVGSEPKKGARCTEQKKTVSRFRSRRILFLLLANTRSKQEYALVGQLFSSEYPEVAREGEN